MGGISDDCLCRWAGVQHQPSDEFEFGFVVVWLFFGDREDELAAVLQTGGEFLLEGRGDGLDGGADEAGLEAILPHFAV